MLAIVSSYFINTSSAYNKVFRFKMTKTRSGKGGAIKELDARVDIIGQQLQSQLNELKKSVQNKGTDDYESPVEVEMVVKLKEFERHMERVLGELKKEIATLRESVKLQCEHLKKETFRNCLLIHGIMPTEKENLYSEVCNILCSRLRADVNIKDISVCYRIGKTSKNKNSQIARPVLVKFIHEWKRDCIYRDKKKLKGSGLVISEMLTPTKYKLLREVKSRVGKEKCWTWQGNVYVCFVDGIRRVKDLTDISEA